MDNLLFTINSILPIILLIGLGYFLKRLNIFPDTFWKMANKLCFRVCLPTLLFYNIYNVTDISLMKDYYKSILFAACAIIIVFIIYFFIVKFFIKDDRQKGVLLQCAFRSNYALIGIPLAEELCNGDSMVLGVAAIISAISIPLFNILAIISLSLFIHEDGKKVTFKDILKKICTNPLIIGVFCGVICLLLRMMLPKSSDGNHIMFIKEYVPFLYKTIENLKYVASPLALIALGGDFTFKAVGKLKHQIIFGTLSRELIVPGACLLIAYFMGFGHVEIPAFIALFATPVAVSSVPMSMEMKNDDELAGQLVVWTSIASAFSLFIIIFIFKSIGIFN
jgi:predicted permease